MKCRFENRSGSLRTERVEKAGSISERVIFQDGSGREYFINNLRGNYNSYKASAWFISANGRSDLCALEVDGSKRTIVDFDVNQYITHTNNLPKFIDIAIRVIAVIIILLLISAVATLGFNPVLWVQTIVRGSRGGAVGPTLLLIFVVSFFALVLLRPFALRSLVVSDSQYREKKSELMSKIMAL